VRLNGTAAQGSEALKNGITYTIFYPKKDLKGNRQRVNYWTGQGMMIQSLKAGQYFITANYGVNGYAEAMIEVKPNELTDHTYNLNFGTLKISGVAAKAAVAYPNGNTFTIFYPQKDINGNRSRINYWTGQGTMIQALKAGSYHVVTQRANANVGTDIVIEANKVLDLKVVIK
jgi:hypothetical protein